MRDMVNGPHFMLYKSKQANIPLLAQTGIAACLLCCILCLCLHCRNVFSILFVLMQQSKRHFCSDKTHSQAVHTPSLGELLVRHCRHTKLSDTLHEANLIQF